MTEANSVSSGPELSARSIIIGLIVAMMAIIAVGLAIMAAAGVNF